MLDRLPGSQRLWLAAVHRRPDVVRLPRCDTASRSATATLPGPWPLDAYQQVFGDRAGQRRDAERVAARSPPSSSLDLARRGVTIAPILLHTGVSSLEAHELPYPERYRVPAATAAHVNAVHAAGGRVVAVGTTVVRALETRRRPQGTVHPGAGWTDLVVTPERGVRAVDGLVTGWHEPEASHLADARGGRRAPAARARVRGGLRARATCGTSSATATCCSRTGRAMSGPGR